jgi:AcrR family transcriptional regulator
MRLPIDSPVRYFTEFIEGRRGEILDAALGVFGEKGYEAGTMREIAAAVGVSEPALYRHYAGKEALFEELVSLAGDRIVTLARTMIADVRPENLRESLGMLIEARRAASTGHESPVIRMLLVSAPHSGVFLTAFRAHLATPMAAMLGELVPRVDGYFGRTYTPAETNDRVRAFMSLFIGHFMTSMVLGAAPTDNATVDAMLKIMDWTE